MFTSIIIILTPFLMVTFLPLALKAFSSDELHQMGVRLEGPEMDSAYAPFSGSNHILPKVTAACMNA